MARVIENCALARSPFTLAVGSQVVPACAISGDAKAALIDNAPAIPFRIAFIKDLPDLSIERRVGSWVVPLEPKLRPDNIPPSILRSCGMPLDCRLSGLLYQLEGAQRVRLGRVNVPDRDSKRVTAVDAGVGEIDFPISQQRFQYPGVVIVESPPAQSSGSMPEHNRREVRFCHSLQLRVRVDFLDEPAGNPHVLCNQ